MSEYVEMSLLGGRGRIGGWVGGREGGGRGRGGGGMTSASQTDDSVPESRFPVIINAPR